MVTTRTSNGRLAQRWPSLKNTTPSKKAPTSNRTVNPKRVAAAKKAVATKRAKANRRAATIAKAVATGKANAAAKKVAIENGYRAEMVASIDEVDEMDEMIIWKEVWINHEYSPHHCQYSAYPIHPPPTGHIRNRDPVFRMMPERDNKAALDEWRMLEKYKVFHLSGTERRELMRMPIINLSFLEMASEIRALIYHHAYTDTKYVISKPPADCQPWFGWWTYVRAGLVERHCNFYSKNWDVQLWQPCAIHLTCKLIYTETRQVARKVTSLDLRWANCLGGYQLPPMPPGPAVNFDSIQKVELMHHLDAKTILHTWKGIKEVVFDSGLLLTFRSALSREAAQEAVVQSYDFKCDDKFRHCKSVARDLGDRVSVSLKIPCTYVSKDGQYIETWTLRLKLPSEQLLDYCLTDVRNRYPGIPDVDRT